MKLVFSHKPNSVYDDIKGARYHFPRQYLKNVEQAVGDLIVYYEEIIGQKGRYYTGVAKITGIRADQSKANHYYADLQDFIDFDRLVAYRDNGGYEHRLVRPDGSISGGLAINAVRPVTDEEFGRIVQDGLSQQDDWPDRIDEIPDPTEGQIGESLLGFAESNQPAILGAPFERPVIQLLMERKWRDAKFKQNIRVAYNRTCAFSGLRLINGKGRPEVEAAHIQPVEDGGNDWVRNGIALSGTIHWMFDRGMLSLSDSFEIMVSRHLNHDISHLLAKTRYAIVPADARLQPHPFYLQWHRQNKFKG